MPELLKSLQNQDLSHLQIIAGLWDVVLEDTEPRQALQQLIAALLVPKKVDEMAAGLPEEARLALNDLLSNGGKLPWSLFTRRHGKLREMGPGRRDRLQPQLRPVSATEMLWYRAFIARAFFDTPDGPQEHAYIPSDLLELLPQPEAPASQLGRAATPSERQVASHANDRVLDHACTLLAALRLEFLPERIASLSAAWQPSNSVSPYPLSPQALKSLLGTAGLLDQNGFPNPETTRFFLELPRAKALAQLARAWMHSQDFNELRLMPGYILDGEWQNEPLKARYAVIDFLSLIPSGSWWNLNAFIEAIHQAYPDYQRPAGDYDSWYIRRAETNEFLRGFQHWADVDGALIRYIITGPLRWLGFIELAAPAADAQPEAFRFSSWAEALLHGAPPDGLDNEDELFLISSDARIRVPRLVPRAARYQLARFSDWERENEDAYLYRLTPASLEQARGQGLRVIHLLTLLRRYALAVPPSLEQALDRWQKAGSEARLDRVTILRVKNPEILQVLRESRAARFLGEPLGPTAIIVNAGAGDKVLAALAEMGFLGETTLVTD